MKQITHNSPGFRPKDSTTYDSTSGLPLEILCLADGTEMVLVPAGEFIMGTSEEKWNQFARLMEPWVVQGDLSVRFFDRQRFLGEMPERVVYLDSFYVDKYEVTNLMYLMFCQKTNHHKPLHWSDKTSMPFGLEYHPVTYVDWQDAWEYACWAGKRLPTEAEWEKAARGTDGRTYPWGDHFDHFRVHYKMPYYAQDLKSESIMNECRKRARVARVDSYPEGASPYGVMDMVGNVWEWVNDWYDSDYYKKGALTNPQGPPQGEYRVVRGGASDYDAEKIRCAFRGISRPTDRDWSIGFRCALSVDEQLVQLLKGDL